MPSATAHPSPCPNARVARRRTRAGRAAIAAICAAGALVLGGCTWIAGEQPEITSTLEPVVDGRTEAFDAVFPGLPAASELRWIEVRGDEAVHAVATFTPETMAQLEADASEAGVWPTEAASPPIAAALRVHVETAFEIAGEPVGGFVEVPDLAAAIGVDGRETTVYAAPAANALYLVSTG